MTTQEIADKLVAYCRTGEYAKCYEELYSPDIISQESQGASFPVTKGFEELKEKGQKWSENVVAVHSSEVSDPIVADGYFTCKMTTDMTFKDRGRTVFDEICVYQVEDGKVVKEQFFYRTDG